MRLWISKNSEVPIREQLVTQIVLGIVSNDLKIAERLPSTRDLARRYHIHANTVSSAYRELARRGEGVEQLVVQIVPVGHNNDRGIVHCGMAHDLSAIEKHLQGLPRSLRVPHDTGATVALNRLDQFEQ